MGLGGCLSVGVADGALCFVSQADRETDRLTDGRTDREIDQGANFGKLLTNI